MCQPLHHTSFPRIGCTVFMIKASTNGSVYLSSHSSQFRLFVWIFPLNITSCYSLYAHLIFYNPFSPMKQSLSEKRDRLRTHLRTEYIQSSVRQKRREALQLSENLSLKQSQLESAIQAIETLTTFDLPVIDSILTSLLHYQTTSLNHPSILTFLISLCSNTFSNHLQLQRCDLMMKVRICLNAFLASPDPIVSPYLPNLLQICRNPSMASLFYNISLVKHWGDERLRLKDQYFKAFLDCIDKQLLERLVELENFVLEDVEMITEGALVRAMRMIDQEVRNPDGFQEEVVKYVLRIVGEMMVTEEVVACLVGSMGNLMEFVVYQQTYSNNAYVKLLGLNIFDRIVQYPKPTTLLFTSQDLLPLILLKRLCQPTHQQNMLILCSIFQKLLTSYQPFPQLLIRHQILEQLVSIAYGATKLRSNIRFQYKKLLLTITLTSNDKNRILLVANNLSAVIVDILRKEMDLELVVMALRCVRELLETEERVVEGEEEGEEEGMTGRIRKELLGKYNVEVVIERLMEHPHAQVAELAIAIVERYFDRNDIEEW